MMKKAIKERIKNTSMLLMASLLTTPIQCFASSGGSSPSTILQNIIDYLTGDIARLVGSLVVVGAGYMYLQTEQIQKKTFVRIVIGMGLILGGPTLAELWWG